jgi:phage gp45-like
LLADEPMLSDGKQQAATEETRFYEISGDRLVLKYNDITSLNIEYYKIIENTTY